MRSAYSFSTAPLVLFLVGCCAACAPTADVTSTSVASTPVASAQSKNSSPVADVGSGQDGSDLARLDALWRSRTTGGLLSDYPVGPGDVVAISVPSVEDLKERTVRVSGDGTVELPLLGLVQVGGLTEAGLREELRHRLEKYMYNPQVDVFVKEYRSRQVAVVGAVRSPGLVTLVSPSATVLDMITQAGGTTDDAADEIVLLPAKPMDPGKVEQVTAPSGEGFEVAGNLSRAAAGPPVAPGSPDPSSLIGRVNGRSIVIPLRSSSLNDARRYLNLPVRPNDVLVVPGGGDVMVVGWVQAPGHFHVGSGLTALAAIGAAGGPMYAADVNAVRLIRTEKNGTKASMRLDLQQIVRGEEPDVPVRGNDVIEVPYSDLKIGPYIFYSILTRMGYGVGLPTF